MSKCAGCKCDDVFARLDALADRLAKVEAACKGCYASAYALASAEGFVRCNLGTCVDRAGHNGPCTPRREAKVASAEGRPACPFGCPCKSREAAKDGSAK